MEKLWPRGNLSDIPFSHLLFRIWRSENSGRLEIKKHKTEKKLDFKNGNIAVASSLFHEKNFLTSLSEKKIMNSPSQKKCEKYATDNKSSIIKSLLELNLLSPARLWKLMELFFISDLFPLFDLPQSEYFFDTEHLPEECEILFQIYTLNFGLQGVRQMQNFDLIKAHIPAENRIVQIISPDYLNQIELDPYEKYLLNLIDNEKKLETIYDKSELGKKESQKVIFALFSLGLIGFPRKKTKENRRHEISPVELGKTLDAFNSKCSYIYKYISKEIGPVALNVLKKCLEETKTNLSLLFQKSEIRADGRIDTRSLLKTNMCLWNEGEKKKLIQDLNEILAAEVLAVKKTLGNEHESILVKNLEKIGELN